MVKKLTFLTAVMFLCVGVLSQHAIAQQNSEASKEVILMHSGTVTTCDATFYDSGGPDGNYTANEDHYLIFLPATTGTRIKVTFLEFETENNYDKLFIYNGTNPAVAPIIATLTGTTLPTEPFYGDNISGALLFRFKSDASVQKAGWKATVECYTPVPNNLVAISLNTTNYATANSPKTIPFAFFNQGSQAVTGTQYTVQLQDAANNVLATANGIDLIPGEHASIDLIWTPTTIGTIDIKGVILFAEDQFPDDNVTPYTTFTVHPVGTHVVQIGSGAPVTSVNIPFDFYYKNSYAQTIYTANQIGLNSGIINSIKYKYNFPNSNPGSKAIKVWMGETTLTNLSGGFINPSTLTLVYDGNADFHNGINDVTINLQTPYNYNGTNLVIYTYRNLDSLSYSTNDLFYLSSTEEQRSRRRGSNSQLDPLAPSSGFSAIYVPDISIVFYVNELGTIAGNVTCEGAPVEGVTVKVVDDTREATTDAAGHYVLPYLIPGTHGIEFTKFGFNDFLVENIQVVGNQTTTVNVSISPIQQYMVSGTVTASDTGLPLEGAVVNFHGYSDYTDTTDAAGHYSMSGVWGGGKEYEVVVDYEGYQKYTGTVTVNNQHISNHNIIVNEIAYPAKNVVATIDEPNVNITWSPPSGATGDPQWITWSGEADITNGVGAGSSPITIAHRFSAENLETLEVVDMSVTKVRFNPHGTGTYKVMVWTGGTATEPGTLVHEQPVANVALSQWNEVELTTPVVIPEGQELWYGVHIVPATANFPAGVDAGPAVAGFGDMCKIADQMWISLTSQGLNYNWALEAYVDNAKGLVTNLSKLHAEYKINPPTVTTINLPSEFKLTSAKESGKPIIVDNSTSRVFTNYTIYRLVKDQPQAEWTQLATAYTDTAYTDISWGTLPAGLYQYAVVANYTNGVTSRPRLSNTLAKDMEAEFIVNITTSGGDPATGATVTLINQDGNEDHIYEATAGATGVTFPAVWKGVYDITVTKFGFEPFTADSIIINADATYPVELIEIIVAPFGLVVIQDGNDEIFTWNVILPGATVILEAHDVWGDGSGYQMLLDADAEEYGQTIPTSGPLAGCNAPSTLYDVFEYKIPENADPVCVTTNAVIDGEEYYIIPPGIYDYVIVNPTGGAQANLWIPGGDNGRKDNYVFETNKTYRFLAHEVGQGDGITIIITDDKTGKIVDIVRPGETVDEYSRIGEVASNQISVVDKLEIGDYYHSVSNQTRAFSGYTIYLDGEEKASGIMDSIYTFTNVSIGGHTAGVKAVYTSGSSEIVELDFVHSHPIFNVKFIIIRSSNNAPIVQANVVISNDSINESALTDVNGVATFQLPAGTYHWVVSKQGFETQEGTIVVDDHGDINISMNSIGNDALAQGFVLYPNPTTNTLTITRNNSSNAMVEIYSNNGIIVNSFEMNEATKEISVSELNSGVYFIRVIENNTTTVQRFIKQ